MSSLATNPRSSSAPSLNRSRRHYMNFTRNDIKGVFATDDRTERRYMSVLEVEKRLAKEEESEVGNN